MDLLSVPSEKSQGSCYCEAVPVFANPLREGVLGGRVNN